MIWPPSGYNCESWQRDVCNHTELRVLLRCDGTSVGNNHVWVLSSREYVECSLDRSRMLEYFPHVKWLTIWKTHYFTGWKSRRGLFICRGNKHTKEDCRLICATCNDQPVFQGD